MDSRELFLNILNFNHSTRTLKWEMGYWGKTIKRWYREGFSKVRGFERDFVDGEFINGPGSQYPMPSYDDQELMAYGLSDFFSLDKGPKPFAFNWYIYPRFEKKVINEIGDKVEYIGNDGIRRLAYIDERSMPQWLEHPVKDSNDWETIKRDRLNLDKFDKRYTADDIDIFIEELKKRDYPLILYGSPIGFFGILRFLIGEEKLYYWYYDKPELLKNILEHLCDMWINIAEELTLKVDFDYGYFFEDMAYKGGSLISPSIFKEFMFPYYKKLIDFAKSRGIMHFIVDSDGNIEDLIPLFQEVGINGFLPFEVQAGNNIELIREKYPKLIIIGGVDKKALKNKDKIDDELEKVKRMLKKGGYIPYIDHAVPPDISWNNYKYYREKLNSIIDAIKVKD